jgi:hypothetical protein
MKVVLFCFSFFLFFFTDPVEKFTYKERPQLVWNDFKGVPPKNAQHFASVNSGMGYHLVSKNRDGKLATAIDVTTIFYPQLSWKKNTKENNQDLLKHEQLHWDISELYARKLRAAYKKYIPQKNPKKEVDYIFRKFEKERLQTQNAYDLETKHGLLKVAQEKWSDKIREELFKTSLEA